MELLYSINEAHDGNLQGSRIFSSKSDIKIILKQQCTIENYTQCTTPKETELILLDNE